MKSELERNEMHVSKLNFIKYDAIKEGQDALTKIRYKSTAVASKIHHVGDERAFDAPVKGIAAGQSAVFYEEDNVK